MKLKSLVYFSLITVVTPLAPVVAQTFSVIHTFSGPEGATPFAGLTLRADGLYGTAFQGGVGYSGNGTIYQILHVGPFWGTTPISLFSTGGANPAARALFGPDGRIYGTTATGGTYSAGVVFNLTPPLTICKTANCFWKENVLYEFQGGADGGRPFRGDLTWDAAGNIYGTTIDGGTGNGTVYELTHSGSSWIESVIYRFSSGSDGGSPWNGLVLVNDGDLIGTTQLGGSYGYGTIYELKYVPGVGWTESNPYSFQNGEDGEWPIASLLSDKSGNLYGATADGGLLGGGTIFELSPSGDTWTFTTIYSLYGTPGQGCGPLAALAMDSADNLYGTTYCQGAYDSGNVFKLTNTGDGWVYTSLYDFMNEADGGFPSGGVTLDGNGTLYGTASGGGTMGNGTVWMITP